MSDRLMSRRELLRAGLGGSVAALASSAGCIESRSPYAPPVLEDRPDGVYIPPHFEGMTPIGHKTDGPIAAVLSYSYPHRFWLLSGTDRSRVRIQPSDSIHLMLQVWARDTAVPLSGTSPGLTVESEGEVIEQRVLWPMLSQRMGFHYGDNLALDGEGEYNIAVDVPPTSHSLAGAFRERLDTPARFSFSFEWRESLLEEIPIKSVETNRQGAREALPPMEGGVAPLGRGDAAPGRGDESLDAMSESLPGQTLGTVRTDEIGIAASLEASGDDAALLRLIALTPHNRFWLPMLGPVGSGGESSRQMDATLDPSVGMHYLGRIPGAESAESLQVSFPTPPQVARHEGYETAFMNPGSVTFER